MYTIDSNTLFISILSHKKFILNLSILQFNKLTSKYNNSNCYKAQIVIKNPHAEIVRREKYLSKGKNKIKRTN